MNFENKKMDNKQIDSLLPSEMALHAESIGVAKVRMPFYKVMVLAILAGSFIALGAVFFTTVTADSTMSYGLTRLLGGISFSLGLILVIVGGAELFTGNNLIIMALANKKLSAGEVLKNWAYVYIGNMFGAFFIALLIFLSKHYLFDSGQVGINALNIAKAKCEVSFVQAIASGILCNLLVCLAVWLSYSTNSISGKIIVIVFPITAFVAIGFEHSIANLYFVPEAILLLENGSPEFITLVQNSTQNYDSITWSNFLVNNLLPVTIGNIIGGALLVGMVYWFVFLREVKKN